LIGLAVAGSSLWGGTWSPPLGPAAIGVTAVPVSMLSLGVMLCRSEAELLAAVPAAMLFCLGSSLRALLFGSATAAALSAAVLVLHCALFLPLPPQEPESNPFNRWFARSLQAFSRWIASPIAGWGDSAE